MARTLLAGQNVVYSGDPLKDLTLGAFLEKFVQKKAKVGVWVGDVAGDRRRRWEGDEEGGLHVAALPHSLPHSKGAVPWHATRELAPHAGQLPAL